MLLQKEIPVTAVRPVPGSPSVLLVVAPRSGGTGEGCYPHTMVRILDQDATMARIAAYRYVVAPDEPGGGECFKSQANQVQVQLDLRTAIGTRRIVAGDHRRAGATELTPSPGRTATAPARPSTSADRPTPAISRGGSASPRCR